MPDAGVLGRRLHDGRERKVRRGLVGLGQHEGGNRQAGGGEQGVGDVLPVADGGGPGPAAGEGHPGELEGAYHEVLEAGVAVDPLAEIEDQVGPASPGEPAKVPQPDRQQLDLMPPAPQDVAHLVDVGHHRGHVLRTPLFATRVEENGNFHQATSARSERPLIRRQAMSATVRMRSS